ncbi:bactofilin family protein [Effusibacillus dendaii]|uniref:Polymer-forming cytoskeletal protein n=1 Tax=Effusibacillus dendaii TaxID=2743772 RepID=A0A7I8D8U5_9BACL|nr:polymer-forming cytoskeletal protein [Effusibacillus dendaii]BCJ86563.1 hypothetical protein skT53_15480 [Effusibacillus dendaii]
MFKKEIPVANGKVDTLIGPNTTIEGKVQATGILRVEGRIRGELESDGDVIIGEKGEVHAHIHARHVTVAGKVTGNISAVGRMHLVTTGSLEGDIEATTIVIEEGAFFKGNCRMGETAAGKGGSMQKEHLESASTPVSSNVTSTYIQTS